MVFGQDFVRVFAFFDGETFVAFLKANTLPMFAADIDFPKCNMDCFA
jgi:hypothetical protein